MADFDYRKFLKENKSTFYSSLTEGQFSWFTQDTEEQIGSEKENTLPFVYMHDDKGNKWLEKNYEGYGEFGGKDYYELLDQMNGGSGDRSEGIKLAFDDTLKGKIKFPALTVSATLPNGHDFTEEAKHDPNQSWYTPEEDDDDDDNYSWRDEEEDDNELYEYTTHYLKGPKSVFYNDEFDDGVFSIGGKSDLQFSWMTHDTDKQIGSAPENRITVYMHDDKGNTWKEDNYRGYGEFGGMSYYELLDKMNGGEGDKSAGTRLAVGELKPKNGGPVLFPALTQSPTLPKGHDFTKEAKSDPNQSWYAPEEGDETLQEAQGDKFDVETTRKIAQQVADAFTAEDDLDLKYVVSPDVEESSFNLDVEAGPNTPGEDWKDANGFSIDNYLGKYAGGSFYIKDGVVINAAARSAKVANVSDEGEVEMISAEDSKADLDAREKANVFVREETKSNKMKKSELKEMIKAALMNEVTLDIDNMEDTHGEEDFLAEADEEVAVDDTEVAVDGEENIDVDTTSEVDPNVKTVQDALTQAQAAAQKLGDAKLTDQIGNTITFFTRQHVASTEKDTMAEGEEIKETQNSEVLAMAEMIMDALGAEKFVDELISAMSTDEAKANLEHIIQMWDLEGSEMDMDEGKKEYYKDAEADDAEHIKALEKDMEDDKKSSMKIGEVMFPMWTKIQNK